MFLGIWSPDAKVNVVSGHRACVETDRGIKKQKYPVVFFLSLYMQDLGYQFILGAGLYFSSILCSSPVIGNILFSSA